MSIGDNIKKYRNEKKISQEKLSALLNISSRTLQNYEANRTVPPLDILIKLSTIFDIEINVLTDNDTKVLEDLRTLVDIKKTFEKDMKEAKEKISKESSLYIPLIWHINETYCNNKYELEKLLLNDKGTTFDDIVSLIKDIIINRLEYHNNSKEKK